MDHTMILEDIVLFTQGRVFDRRENNVHSSDVSDKRFLFWKDIRL